MGNSHDIFFAKEQKETARVKNFLPAFVADFVYQLNPIPGSQPESSIENREGYSARMPFPQKLIEITLAYII